MAEMARTGTSEGDPAPRDVMREGGSTARARRDVLVLALLAVGTMAAYAAIIDQKTNDPRTVLP